MKTTSYHYITYPSWRSCFVYLAVDMRRMIWSLTGCSKVLRRANEIHSYGQYCILNMTARSTDVSFSHSIFSRCFTTSQKVLHLRLWKKKLRKNVWISFVFANRHKFTHETQYLKKKKHKSLAKRKICTGAVEEEFWKGLGQVQRLQYCILQLFATFGSMLGSLSIWNISETVTYLTEEQPCVQRCLPYVWSSWQSTFHHLSKYLSHK